MAEAKSADLIPVERIAAQIYVIRGQSVMLDSDLAELYGVSTSRLNEQVKRNARRFPDDFSFQLTAEEALMSQFAISKVCWSCPNRRRKPGLGFTWRMSDERWLSAVCGGSGSWLRSRGRGVLPSLARDVLPRSVQFSVAIDIRTLGPVKNPRQEARGGVFSLRVDPDHLVKSRSEGAPASDQRQT